MKLKLDFLSRAFRPRPLAPASIPIPQLLLALIPTFFLAWLVTPPSPQSLPDVLPKAGEIAQEEIVITQDLTLVDQSATENQRARIRLNHIPHYQFLTTQAQETALTLANWVQFLQQASSRTLKGASSLAEIAREHGSLFGTPLSRKTLKEVLGQEYLHHLPLSAWLERLNQWQHQGIVVTRAGMPASREDQIRIGGQAPPVPLTSLLDREQMALTLTGLWEELGAEETVARQLGLTMSALVAPSIQFDPQETEEDLNRALAAVHPVMVSFKAGQVLLRKGDEVSAEKEKALQLLKENPQHPEPSFPPFLINAFLLYPLLIFVWYICRHHLNRGLNRGKTYRVILATLAIGLLTQQAILKLLPLILRSTTLPFPTDPFFTQVALPVSMGGLTLAFIFNLPTTLLFILLSAVTGGILTGWNFGFFLYTLTASLAAAAGIERFQRLKRSPVIKAALLWALPAQILFTLLLLLEGQWPLDIPHLAGALVMVLSSVFISMILATFLIPLWEYVFALLTDLKLIELNNLNLPIFREMLEKAPGTYHHSQMVASLCEAAARDLDISPLLVTAMALYHDIGKLESPQYFTENHSIYPNPHPQLSPRESARSIIAHVNAGLERARALKLPLEIQAGIPQHHGSRRLHFFYHKARKEAEMDRLNPEEIDEKSFRYHGDRPQSLEAAILMLADQVEAASKSLANPTDEEIGSVIRKILETTVEEHQFDDCEDLSFKRLNLIAGSFYRKLSSIYHMRIAYPGFNFRQVSDASGEESHD